ncbi:hypothetical protein SPFM12_00187 [Salmonella phage SPFM12]|nr:hypothetical protein SPFM12_00187 [Salmonella phage SPFM12]
MSLPTHLSKGTFPKRDTVEWKWHDFDPKNCWEKLQAEIAAEEVVCDDLAPRYTAECDPWGRETYYMCVTRRVMTEEDDRCKHLKVGSKLRSIYEHR